MTRNIAVGIDIGTATIKVVVAQQDTKNVAPKIIGMGMSETRGLRHGHITQHDEALQSLRKALALAEKSAGIEIKKASLAIGGIGLTSHLSQASVMISRADTEITDLDVQKVQDTCEQDLPSAITQNKTLLHAIPLAHRIDGKPVIGRPQGMKGLKLEVRMLFIFALEQHLHDLELLVNEANVEIESIVAGPIAGSLVSLSKAQKVAGVVLANIGAETVSVSVFENNIPLSLEVFPIGSQDITNDIALGLRIPLEEADKVKTGDSDEYPKKKYEEIIQARLVDIFELIENHLKKLGRNGLLPAGIVLCGGGAFLSGIENVARQQLRLPSRIAQMNHESTKAQPKDCIWSLAYGTCVFGLSTTTEQPYGIRNTVAQTKTKILDWIKQFLP